MIINTKDIEKLLRMPIPDLTLERETGVTRQTIFNARKGNTSLDKMWLGTAKKLQKWIDENMQFQDDCTGLLEEAKSDLIEFGDTQVLVVLENRSGHDYIVDYVIPIDDGYSVSDLKNGDKIKVSMMSDLVNQLSEQNG